MEPGAPETYFDKRPHLGLCENGTLIECAFRVKGGKVQTERMFSGLHVKADARRLRVQTSRHQRSRPRFENESDTADGRLSIQAKVSPTGDTRQPMLGIICPYL